MGKGQIIEDYGLGHYKVKIIYGGRQNVADRISILDKAIANMQTQIDNETDEYKKSVLTLRKRVFEKSKSYLQDYFPDDPEEDIYCADFTVGLTGDVGTIEIPGESQYFNIQPGYDGNAVYNGERDGEIWPAIAGSGDWSYFNQAILPGWQKWMPTFRFARIVEIDYGTDTCLISIPPAYSSQQGLSVNQGEGTNLGGGDTYYQTTGRTDPGWDDFKSRYPSHPLVTNTAEPEKVPSTDQIVAQIWAIDEDVNSKHFYKTDASYRNKADFWDIMSGDDPNALLNDKGDCEDFALTKADKLINDLGLSPNNMQIALCYTQGGAYHANLLVPTTNHGTLVLDIGLIGRKTKAQLDSINYYSWDMFLVGGDQWANDSREVYTVPIEYMDCNSAVFSIGDNVVIKFEGQDWSQPKVVGFAENPQECGVWFYRLFGNAVGSFGIYDFRLNMVTKVAETVDSSPAQNTKRFESGAAPVGAGLLIVGGFYSGETFDRFNNVDLMAGKAYLARTNLPGTARSGVSCFNISEKVYAAGGWDYYSGEGIGYSSRFSHCYEFDPTSNIWAAKTSMPSAMSVPGGETVGGKGYVYGSGYFIDDEEDNEAVEKLIYEYDAVLNSWSSKQQTSNEQWTKGLFVANSEAYMLGGFCKPDHVDVSPDPKRTHSLQAYKPLTNSWSIKNNMLNFSAPSQYPGTYYGMSANAADRNYSVCAGFEDKGYIHTRMINGQGVIEYDPGANSFSVYSTQEGDDFPSAWTHSAVGGVA